MGHAYFTFRRKPNGLRKKRLSFTCVTLIFTPGLFSLLFFLLTKTGSENDDRRTGGGSGSLCGALNVRVMARTSNSIWVYVRTGSPGSCFGRASPGVVLTEEFVVSHRNSWPTKTRPWNTLGARACLFVTGRTACALS